MPKKTADIERALRKKGFTEDTTKSHNKYVLYIDGKKTNINTHTSKGGTHKEISDSLVLQMARQMHLTKQEFDNYVKCTLSEIEYKKILIEKKALEI